VQRRNRLLHASQDDGCGGEFAASDFGTGHGVFQIPIHQVVNRARGAAGVRLWQRSFHDHVIRSEESLYRLRKYVAKNPLRWELDQLHPDQPSKW
jgi:REP-associated tyrosine transposase